MKTQFPGYYRPGPEEFAAKFKECVFCFDTNVLLNLYRYTPESRDNLINVLRTVKDRVWVPYQVGLEFQRNRLDVLLGELDSVGRIEKLIDSAIAGLEKLRRSSLYAINSLIDPVSKELETIKANLQEKKQAKPDLLTGDPVFSALTELLDGKVGNPYKPEELEEIYKEGKKRYEKEIPPGFKDKSNIATDTNQYGDLVLWHQLMDHARGEKRPIVFVTDDTKEDWWAEARGETLGPRPELRHEFMLATGGKWFYMYTTEQFLKHADEHLGADVSPEVIKEAEGIKKQDAEQELARFVTSAIIPDPSADARRILAAFPDPSAEARRILAGISLRDLSNLSGLSEEMRSSLADISLRDLHCLSSLSEEMRRSLAGISLRDLSNLSGSVRRNAKVVGRARTLPVLERSKSDCAGEGSTD